MLDETLRCFWSGESRHFWIIFRRLFATERGGEGKIGNRFREIRQKVFSMECEYYPVLLNIEVKFGDCIEVL